MVLSSVYIPKNSLSYIFGENHQGQILNLGSKYTYEFSEDDNNIILQSRKENLKFIDDFFGKNISLITAIVGRNGIGKTSILRAMNNPLDIKHKDLIYVFEDFGGEIHLVNESKKNITSNLEEQVKIIDSRFFEAQYYSPILAHELSETHSSISQMTYFNGTLEDYHLDSIIRNLLLLNDPLLVTIKEVYSDFPTYEKVLVKAKQHRKSHFRGVYLEANFANPNTGDALKNYLESELQRLKHNDYDISISKKELEEIYSGNINFLDRESFSALFGKLWSLEEYEFKNERDYIHDGIDIIKNFEITILSYLILGAVFPQTGLGESFSFDKILENQNFNDRINKFLELYLINEDAIIYEKIKSDLDAVNVDDKEQMIDIIDRQTWVKLGGLEHKPVRERMKSDVEMFFKIKEFYNYLLSIVNDGVITVVDGNVEFVVNENADLFYEFIEKYKLLLQAFKGIPITISILEFNTDKQLSTGEKAIIDFYASLNSYIDNSKDKEHFNYPYFLLLLDEPELGYHPLWKKKFIQAMTKIIPVIFSKLTPRQYDATTREYLRTQNDSPTIQIIFCTHDPLTLSDIPHDKVLYLNRSPDEKYSFLEKENHIKSFGANITDLLADSFFIEDGLIGDFVKKKIEDTVIWLNVNDDHSNSEYYRKLIESIDEPIVQRKLAEMFDYKMRGTITIDVIEKQIQTLEALKQQLRNDSRSTR